MAGKLNFSLVSPEREVFSGQVDQVDAPGVEGDFGVLPEHAPFMTALREGPVTVYDGQGVRRFEVRGGFADVNAAGLTILAEQSVPLAEFDTGDLQAQIKAAEEELNRAATPEDKSYAQEVVSGLLNLAIEAQHIDGAHVH